MKAAMGFLLGDRLLTLLPQIIIRAVAITLRSGIDRCSCVQESLLEGALWFWVANFGCFCCGLFTAAWNDLSSALVGRRRSRRVILLGQ